MSLAGLKDLIMLIWQEELITRKINHCLTMTDFMIIFQLTMTFHHHHSSSIISLAPLRGCRQGDPLFDIMLISFLKVSQE